MSAVADGTERGQRALLSLERVAVVTEQVRGRGRQREVMQRQVLQDVSFDVEVAEAVGLVAAPEEAAALVRVAGRVTAPSAGVVRRVGAGDGDRVQVVLRGAEQGVPARTILEELVGWRAADLGPDEAERRRRRAGDALALVGLDPDRLTEPFHASPTVDRRRALLARAAVADPDVLVLEGLTAGLGPIDRGQLLDAVLDVRRASGCSLLVHDDDLAFTASVCDRIVVVHEARVVEVGPTAEIVGHAAHPYTRALFEALPVPRPAIRRAARPRPTTVLPTLDPPTGCRFHPRCWLADERCVRERPALEPRPGHGGDHAAACFHSLP